MGSRETASTVSVSASHSTQKWLRSPLEWPRLLPARLPRLPRCPNRCLHLLSLLASCPPSLSLIELRLLLVRSPPSLRKEFLELPPLSILRRLAVCSPSLTDRSSWRLSFSTKVSDPPLTSVSLCPVSDPLPRPSPRSKWLAP